MLDEFVPALNSSKFDLAHLVRVLQRPLFPIEILDQLESSPLVNDIDKRVADVAFVLAELELS